MELPDAIFKQALDNALDIILITDVDHQDPGNNTIVYVNDAFVSQFGYSKEEIIGQSPRILQGNETDSDTRNRIRKALKEGQPIHAEIVNYDKWGNRYWIELKMVPLYDQSGAVSHFLFIERDLSQQKQKELQLYQEATIDGLTQIFNRQHTYQLAGKALQQASRYKGRLSVILFDIDHFKQVNDTFGHPVGDRVLVKIAQTIRQEIRKADIFGRVGGEEFLLLLPKISVDNASCFAERIRSRVAELQWDDTPIAKPITISLGITQYHQKDSLEDLIARADQALYQAKHKGRNCWVKLVAANASN
jgi:diguanylate cyclase (GGDEF)-like protein/PAS domain S-box-containing protein